MRGKTKKDLLANAPSSYQLTPIPGGVGGDDDRLVVTRDQAIHNITYIHKEALFRSNTGVLPQEALCGDSRCPVCSELTQQEQI